MTLPSDAARLPLLCGVPEQKLTSPALSEAARQLSAQRKTHAGGRKLKRTRCRKCRAWCDSAREAWVHCQRKTQQAGGGPGPL